MVTLPIAFLSLVPSGAVGRDVYDAIRVVVALFPFKPALHAMTAALDPAGPASAGRSLHLAILIVAYGAARPLRPAPLRRGLSGSGASRSQVGSGHAGPLHRRRRRRARAGAGCAAAMPELRERHAPDLVIVNGENSAGGRRDHREDRRRRCSRPAPT